MLWGAGGLGADSAPWPWGGWSGDGFQSDETLADLSGGLHGEGGPRAYLGGRQVNRYMMWSLEELGRGGESKEPALGDHPRWALRTRRLISFLLGGTVFIPFCRH